MNTTFITISTQLQTLRHHHDSLARTVSILSDTLYTTEKSNSEIMGYVLSAQQRIVPLLCRLQQMCSKSELLQEGNDTFAFFQQLQSWLRSSAYPTSSSN